MPGEHVNLTRKIANALHIFGLVLACLQYTQSGLCRGLTQVMASQMPEPQFTTLDNAARSQQATMLKQQSECPNTEAEDTEFSAFAYW